MLPIPLEILKYFNISLQVCQLFVKVYYALEYIYISHSSIYIKPWKNIYIKPSSKQSNHDLSSMIYF